MHGGRIVTLLGAALAVAGLVLKALVLDGVDALPALSEIAEVPAEIPTIWGGLDAWTRIAVVIVLVVVVALALRPPLREPEDRWSAALTTTLGALFFVYALGRLLDASDESLALMEAFDALAGAGVLPDALQGSTVGPGPGFFLLLLGAAFVTGGGVSALVAKPHDEGTPLWRHPAVVAGGALLVVIATWSAIATSLANRR